MCRYYFSLKKAFQLHCTNKQCFEPHFRKNDGKAGLFHFLLKPLFPLPSPTPCENDGLASILSFSRRYDKNHLGASIKGYEFGSETNTFYNFKGRYNLVRFLKTMQKAGLYAHLRIGPYVWVEWNFGGLSEKHYLMVDWMILLVCPSEEVCIHLSTVFGKMCRNHKDASEDSRHHLEQKINTRHCFSAVVSCDPFKSPIETVDVNLAPMDPFDLKWYTIATSFCSFIIFI
ncbi:hypothetical protein DVH24_000278 [Malus domestica]|uniref:beta-galactosidase n=1 Tax=Malus domestica TaxID=3750 RepID=A0A498IZ34_MALDO|nr:hypothetical protein DVH24_000278 [Malus domestica]